MTSTFTKKQLEEQIAAELEVNRRELEAIQFQEEIYKVQISNLQASTSCFDY
jgi:hypothetical protein